MPALDYLNAAWRRRPIPNPEEIVVSTGLYYSILDELLPNQRFVEVDAENRNNFMYRGVRIVIGAIDNEWRILDWRSPGPQEQRRRMAQPEPEVTDVVWD